MKGVFHIHLTVWGWFWAVERESASQSLMDPGCWPLCHIQHGASKYIWVVVISLLEEEKNK